MRASVVLDFSHQHPNPAIKLGEDWGIELERDVMKRAVINSLLFPSGLQLISCYDRGMKR